MGLLVVQLLFPVAHDPQVVLLPSLEDTGESSLDSLVQILEQSAGMLSAEGDFVAEKPAVAAERLLSQRPPN